MNVLMVAGAECAPFVKLGAALADVIGTLPKELNQASCGCQSHHAVPPPDARDKYAAQTRASGRFQHTILAGRDVYVGVEGLVYQRSHVLL